MAGMDLGVAMTNSRYRKVLKKVREIYREAAQDVNMKATSWAHAHDARAKKYKQQVENGEITEDDYKAWMRGQVFQGDAWLKRQKQMAEAMEAADEAAMKYINGGKVDVYADNANFLGYTVEKDLGVDVGFGLYDREAVGRLIRDDPNLLPMPAVNKDKDVEQYQRVIRNAVTQGIIQGEDVDGIALRITMETEDRAVSNARRNARTAYTAAQNAGRQEGMRKAELLGVSLKKRWMCTLDEHTRDAHQALDGQEVDVSEPFMSSLGPIMYPGDPSADPANVYNCRCTMVQINPKRPLFIDRRDAEDNRVGAVTYKEWVRQKAAAAAASADSEE